MRPSLDQSNPRSVFSSILTDVHFWIPLAVLFFGLWVLHWTR